MLSNCIIGMVDLVDVVEASESPWDVIHAPPAMPKPWAELVRSATAMATSWALATLLGLDTALRLSLLPRFMSTPFAVAVAGDIGGIPDLIEFFVILTGVSGAVIGEAILARLPIRSTLARGAALGIGAHAVGTAKAREMGTEEGSIAGLVMVLVGICNVLIAPLLALLLHHA